MTKGKHWTAQEEAKLRTLVDANAKIQDIAAQLQKTPGAIIIKSQRLGLRLQTKGYSRNSVALPRELPSVEETLKMLAGALRTATKQGLNKVEVQRLQVVATLSKTYNEKLADYINYREIEMKLKEMEELNARLLKETGQSSTSQNNAAKPDSTHVA